MRSLLAVMFALVIVGTGAGAVSGAPEGRRAAQSDLDDFMAQVIARRDGNWKKLRQYVLDEREQVEVVGPGRTRLWGDRREYTWYIRDGFFVRSPTLANGVAVPEADRRKYEAEFLARAQQREKAGRILPEPAAAADEAPASVEGLIPETRRPQFIDSAYFLRFKFEPERYALVGRETFEGRSVLRIEYYPARLFTHEQDAEAQRRKEGRRDGDEDVEASMERMMNKVSLVTLWVIPDTHQIVKYTFDNVDLDFLPVPWLMRVTDLGASMTMSQPFPDVWLPRDVDMLVSGQLAVGDVVVKYHVDYHDYREATSGARVILPGGQ
jgi:hypothetical protein